MTIYAKLDKVQSRVTSRCLSRASMADTIALKLSLERKCAAIGLRLVSLRLRPAFVPGSCGWSAEGTGATWDRSSGWSVYRGRSERRPYGRGLRYSARIESISGAPLAAPYGWKVTKRQSSAIEVSS